MSTLLEYTTLLYSLALVIWLGFGWLVGWLVGWLACFGGMECGLIGWLAGWGWMEILGFFFPLAIFLYLFCALPACLGFVLLFPSFLFYNIYSNDEGWIARALRTIFSYFPPFPFDHSTGSG
jgi:hypothetical protein